MIDKKFNLTKKPKEDSMVDMYCLCDDDPLDCNCPIHGNKNHKVALLFDLGEIVTPEIFAKKVTDACIKYGVLRQGEKIIEPISKTKYIAT